MSRAPRSKEVLVENSALPILEFLRQIKALQGFQMDWLLSSFVDSINAWYNNNKAIRA